MFYVKLSWALKELPLRARYPGLFNLLLAILEFLLEYLRKVMATEMESERQRAALEINMLEIYTEAIRAHTIELCLSTFESSNL